MEIQARSIVGGSETEYILWEIHTHSIVRGTDPEYCGRYMQTQSTVGSRYTRTVLWEVFHEVDPEYGYIES